MNESIKFSIIVPAYNIELYIGKTIESCLNQSYKNIELIIINDGSTDETPNVIKQYIHDSRIIFIEQPNTGVSAARNKGLEVASGEFILFVDGDDLLEKETIRKNAALLSKYQAIEWLAFPITRTDENLNKLFNIHQDQLSNYTYTKEEILTPSMIFERYEAGTFPPIICACIFRHKLIKQFQFENGRFEDTSLFLDIIENNNNVLLSPYGNYYYVDRQNSFINQEFSAEKWIMYTKVFIKRLRVANLLLPESKTKYKKQETRFYYTLKYLKFKYKSSPEYGKPLSLFLNEFPNKSFNIKLGGILLLKCLFVVLLRHKHG